MTYAESSDMGQVEGVGGAKTRTRTSFLGRFAIRGWVTALALGLSLGLSFVSAGPASAYVGQNFLRNWQTGRCLDSNHNGEVYTLPCQQGNDYQTWEPVFVAHYFYDVVEVHNKATGLCLYLTAQNQLATSNCNNSSNALWIAAGSWDVLQLQSFFNSTQCLDSNAAGSAYVLGCNGGGYQNWRLGY
ncbi:ACP synthase [Streptomyces sp. NPDC002588]|uniref:RICIN domain-containing protein n=1 Tax=Streptomyces sp. NPDC002588 TaxID=3154419 RepID=UPI0033285070